MKTDWNRDLGRRGTLQRSLDRSSGGLKNAPAFFRSLQRSTQEIRQRAPRSNAPALSSLFEFLNDRIWRWFLLQSCIPWSYIRAGTKIRSIGVHVRELWTKCQSCSILVRTSRASTETALKSSYELRIHFCFDRSTSFSTNFQVMELPFSHQCINMHWFSHVSMPFHQTPTKHTKHKT